MTRTLLTTYLLADDRSCEEQGSCVLDRLNAGIVGSSTNRGTNCIHVFYVLYCRVYQTYTDFVNYGNGFIVSTLIWAKTSNEEIIFTHKADEGL